MLQIAVTVEWRQKISCNASKLAFINNFKVYQDKTTRLSILIIQNTANIKLILCCDSRLTYRNLYLDHMLSTPLEEVSFHSTPQRNTLFHYPGMVDFQVSHTHWYGQATNLQIYYHMYPSLIALQAHVKHDWPPTVMIDQNFQSYWSYSSSLRPNFSRHI